TICDPELRALVERRFTEICPAGEPYDYQLHGHIVVVEPGDSVYALEEKTCPILHGLYDDVRFGDPDCHPISESIEEYPTFFEFCAVLGDGDGDGVLIYVPKQEG